MHDQERQAAEPEDKEADHGSCVDALALWDIVFEGQKRGPDGADHDTDGICAVHVLDGEPEDGENGAGNDGEIGAPEPPGGTGNDGKGDMVEDANCAVECDNKGYGEEGEGDDAQRFTPG